VGITKKKKLFFWVAGIVSFIGALPFLFLFGLMAFETVKERVNRVPFDSTAWKSPQDCHSSSAKRIRMVDDLFKQHTLAGISQAEVKALLGEQDTNTPFSSQYDLVYCLGPQRGFLPIDSEWLVIKLGENKVQESRIVND
jgi:hypothetical protein